MDIFLRWGLLFIAFFVASLIFYDVWFRRGSRSNDKNESVAKDSVNEPFLTSKSHLDSYEQDTAYRWNADSSINEEDDLLPETAPVIKPVTVAEPSVTAHSKPAIADDIIIISVLAKPSAQFASYDLFQAISATGMQYGEMSIFHYYESTETGLVTLFSLASATKPGKFDLDRMGDFSCVGLSLFMDKNAVPNAEQAFLTMLEKAEQLADDLDGELRAGPERKPWNSETLQTYLSAM